MSMTAPHWENDPHRFLRNMRLRLKRAIALGNLTPDQAERIIGRYAFDMTWYEQRTAFARPLDVLLEFVIDVSSSPLGTQRVRRLALDYVRNLAAERNDQSLLNYKRLHGIFASAGIL